MNGGADDKRQRRIFAAFTAVTVFAALFTAAALGLIVSPLITKAYSYAVYALSAAFLLAAAGFFFICKKDILAAGAANIVGGAVMSAPIIMMAVGNFPPGATVFNIVVNALFALIKIVSAIMTTVRGARSGDFTARALRNFGLTTALMSLQMLEMTIVGYTTGGDTMWLMVAVIGGIADGVTIFAGIYMMIRGALALKRAEKAGKTA